MNQNRKDQDVPNRQSNMEKAEGSRTDTERNRSSDASGSRGSVMDDQETFENGSGVSEVARGMGSAGERGGSTGTGGRSSQKSGISNRGIDQERQQQNRIPERGRSQSDE